MNLSWGPDLTRGVVKYFETLVQLDDSLRGFILERESAGCELGLEQTYGILDYPLQQDVLSFSVWIFHRGRRRG